MADADVRVVSVFCPDSTEETASVAPFQTRVTNLIDNVDNWHVCHMFFFVHFSHRLTDSDAALCHQRARLLLWSTLNAEHCVREDRDLMHVSCLCDCCSNTRELKGARRHVGSNPQPARPLWRKSWLPPHIPQVFHVVKLEKTHSLVQRHPKAHFNLHSSLMTPLQTGRNASRRVGANFGWANNPLKVHIV